MRASRPPSTRKLLSFRPCAFCGPAEGGLLKQAMTYRSVVQLQARAWHVDCNQHAEPCQHDVLVLMCPVSVHFCFVADKHRAGNRFFAGHLRNVSDKVVQLRCKAYRNPNICCWECKPLVPGSGLQLVVGQPSLLDGVCCCTG